jgi:hypothetical protein
MDTLPDGYRIDAEAGLIYGIRGKPVGSPDSSGYLQVDVRTGGVRRMVSVHRAVWVSVNGPIPLGMEPNHRNGIKHDNSIGNLELLTHRDNIKHAYATGLKSNRGMKHPSRKLDDTRVREIRKLARDGYATLWIARRFSVSRKTISDILIRKTWSHVEG